MRQTGFGSRRCKHRAVKSPDLARRSTPRLAEVWCRSRVAGLLDAHIAVHNDAREESFLASNSRKSGGRAFEFGRSPGRLALPSATVVIEMRFNQHTEVPAHDRDDAQTGKALTQTRSEERQRTGSGTRYGYRKRSRRLLSPAGRPSPVSVTSFAGETGVTEHLPPICPQQIWLRQYRTWSGSASSLTSALFAGRRVHIVQKAILLPAASRSIL